MHKLANPKYKKIQTQTLQLKQNGHTIEHRNTTGDIISKQKNHTESQKTQHLPNKINNYRHKNGGHKSALNKSEIMDNYRSIDVIRNKERSDLHEKCHTERKNKLHLSREEKITFHLDQDLRQFGIKHRLREKRPQIKYVKTLKKIQLAGNTIDCKIRAKSSGIQIQLFKEREKKQKREHSYAFQKQYGRFFKKSIVKRIKSCYQEAQTISSVMNQNSQIMIDSLVRNEQDKHYKAYTADRMEIYFQKKANLKLKYPFYIKKQIEDKIEQVQQLQRMDEEAKNIEAASNTLGFNSQASSPRLKKTRSNIEIDQEMLQSQKSNPTFRNTKNSQIYKWVEYEEDITQFMEICVFFSKIQNQLLRYLPNNHIRNKLKAVMDQVENGQAIKKIFEKCNTNVNYFIPEKIVLILKKYKGILSIMNYIVNIIMLNISAERRKRFKDKEEIANKFQNIINQKKLIICNKLKNISPNVRKQIFQCVSKANVQCLGFKPEYVDFAKRGEHQQFSQLDTFKNRTTICQILKYQNFMK